MSIRRWKAALKVLVVAALLYGANQLSHSIAEALQFDLRPSNEDVVHRVITISAFFYTCLLAVPFVPGAEIGIALLVTLGPPIAFLVYLCTVFGLVCSFVIGRYVPLKSLRAIADAVKLSRLALLLEQIEPLSREERTEYLTGRDNRALSRFLQYRYLTLALLFNLPGNFLIGGGGGIGMIAGMSGLFSLYGYLITVMIAVSPVPLLVSIFGTGFLM
ncbi:MAG TPA: hypothetical protein VK862_09690 [Afifellaceae bacterium]|nr:hypothetical protein [Afifellaceae bacterium]